MILPVVEVAGIQELHTYIHNLVCHTDHMKYGGSFEAPRLATTVYV